MKKFVSLLMTIMMAMFMMSSTVFATLPNPVQGDTLTPIGNRVLGYVQWFGMAVSMGMLIYVGIKYTMAPANEKADLKAASIKYIIGAIIIFGVTGLFTLLKTLSDDII